MGTTKRTGNQEWKIQYRTLFPQDSIQPDLTFNEPSKDTEAQTETSAADSLGKAVPVEKLSYYVTLRSPFDQLVSDSQYHVIVSETNLDAGIWAYLEDAYRNNLDKVSVSEPNSYQVYPRHITTSSSPFCSHIRAMLMIL